jgi:predicted choloylglycine hydrolase
MSILTRDERERLELARIVEKEKVRDQIYEKYNPAIVKKVTGLVADDEVIEFMLFCDFGDDFLIKVNKYDLMALIESKFRVFKARRQAGDEGIFLSDPVLSGYSV